MPQLIKQILTKTIGDWKHDIEIRLGTCYPSNLVPEILITHDSYQNGVFRSGGVCPDELLVLFGLPELVAMHMCDVQGVPLFAVENGFFNLHQNPRVDAAGYQRAYRVTAEEYAQLYQSEDKIEFAILIEELGILDRWHEEGKAAVACIEELAGCKFVGYSPEGHGNYVRPSDMEECKALRARGYYAPEKKIERMVAAELKERARKRARIIADAQKASRKAFARMRIELLILDRLGPACVNFIHYTHTNTIVFNWDKSEYKAAVTRAEFDGFLKSLTDKDRAGLPADLKFELKEV